MFSRRRSRVIRKVLAGRVPAEDTFGNKGFEIVPDTSWTKDKVYLGGNGYRKGFENFSAIPNGSFAAGFDNTRKTNVLFSSAIEMLATLDGISKVFHIESLAASDDRGVQTRFTNTANQPAPVPSGNIGKFDGLIRIGDASQQGVVGLYNWAFTEIGVVYISGDKWYTTNNVGTPVLLSDLPDPQDDRWYHVHTDVNYTTGVITISIDGTTSSVTGNWVGATPINNISVIVIANALSTSPAPAAYSMYAGGFDSNILPGYFDGRILEDIPQKKGSTTAAWNFTDFYHPSARTNYLDQQATILLVDRPTVSVSIWMDEVAFENPQEVGSQLLANPTFDVDLSNWTVNAIPGIARTGVIIRDTVDPYAGAGALQVQGVGSGGGASSEFVSITGGLAYLVEFYYKKVLGNPGGELYVSYYDSSQDLLGNKAILIMNEPAPSSYEQRRFYLYPPSEASYVKVHPAVKGNNRDANFDEFKLIRLGLPFLKVQDGHGSGTIFYDTPAYDGDGFYTAAITYTKSTDNATIRIEGACEYGIIAIDEVLIR